MKKIIFDTDLGGDCDDVMALDLLISADRAGECELLGVTYSADVKAAPACIYAILNYHGKAGIPIGRRTLPDGYTGGADVYASAVANAFPDENAPAYETGEDAVKVLRSLLAANEHVTLCATGFLSNVAALLNSEPDGISPLSGAELVKASVDEIVIMAANFSHQTGINPMPSQIGEDGQLSPAGEYNVICDLPAAAVVFEKCPVRLVFSPFEVGYRMYSGKAMVEAGQGKTPDSLAYITHGSQNGRDSWDPATALYAVCGAKPWFYLTAPGKVSLIEDGATHFDPAHGGNHFLLECAMPQAEIAAELDRLALRLYDVQ